ncbi:ribosome small subunit-dependent GTPase A [Paracoccus liaowanqingii]|uniref:Small ribosomal subunit biogenesis GTPase RsgA n=1 Tax=Paracoccus liaowanqingii TaxID=2560053 RepID=A0A4Z1CSY0_9RHOB|nr:ribosome small subunit-dependent GTPase A [Paracoccus liaowanqingii]TGN68398.1 ribosome small subunit-dependent GTPase A [Paracoccus liaowanqingii]
MTASALADLGWQPFFAEQITPDDAGLVPMRVASVHRSRLSAETGAGQVRLELPLHATTADYAVGDWVLAHADTRVLARRLDRRALLRRRTEGADTRQLIAANIDTLFIVTSCNDDFNAARLERYLALANEAGTQPVIVLTKIDKVDDPAPWRDQALALQRGLEVVLLNAKDPNAAAVLAPWCGTGRTVALVGSSGVGKSTLLNTLADKAEGQAQLTGAIREGDAKGRHTTTARSLHPISGGGWVIDTPGMRTLHVADVAAGLEMLFAEITELAPLCRFRDCTHAHEPGCAVQAAIAAGTLSADRLERWRKLSEENTANTPVQTGPRGNRTTIPRGGKRR